MATIACGRALADDGGGNAELSASARAAGVVLGNAFGSVDGSAAFMKRLTEKGARLASPADFPTLVPSSPAGYVSIYLGLGGPTLVVADLGTSGECALTQGWELVAAGEIDRVVTCAVEDKSVIVDGVFRIVFGPDREGEVASSRPARREGAGAVALAAEDVALRESLPILAVVEQVLSWTNAAHVASDLVAPPVGDARAAVVLGGPSPAVDDVVARSSWSSVPRVSVGERAGSHEAAGGIALAVAASMIAAEDGPNAVLCVGSARGWGYAVVLTRKSP